MLRQPLLVAFLVAFIAIATTAALAHQTTQKQRRQRQSSPLKIQVAINAAHTDSLPARSDFASFSVEVPCFPKMVLDGSTGQVRPSYINLLNFLRNASGNSNNALGPNVRIGGNSADESYYAGNNSAAPLPPGDKNRILDSEIDTYKNAALWNGTLSVDISMRNETDPSNAVAYALSVLDRVPNNLIDAFEIGNEMDLAGGSKQAFRPSNYNFTGYLGDFQRYLAALQKARPDYFVASKVIQGAVLCCKWMSEVAAAYLPQFSGENKRNDNNNVLKTLDYHHYPLNGATATIDELMSFKSVDLKSYRGLAAASLSRGVRFIIGEGNSAYDGGRWGVSNAFAASLWSLDLLFNALQTGIRRWNFHGCGGEPAHEQGSSYTPIDCKYSGPCTARPLYYGMWVFTFAVANEARIVQQTVTCAADPKHHGFVSFHSVISSGDSDKKQQLRVVAIHKDTSSAAQVAEIEYSVGNLTVLNRKLAPTGKLYRLNVTGLPANAEPKVVLAMTHNVQFGGQTFENSTTGLPLGDVSYETVQTTGSSLSSFTVVLQPASALVAVFDLV